MAEWKRHEQRWKGRIEKGEREREQLVKEKLAAEQQVLYLTAKMKEQKLYIATLKTRVSDLFADIDALREYQQIRNGDLDHYSSGPAEPNTSGKGPAGTPIDLPICSQTMGGGQFSMIRLTKMILGKGLRS